MNVKFVEFLQGKWLGHPLHPAIVHVPVGGWLLACALDVFTLAAGSRPAMIELAFWCVGMGLVGALVAVPLGIADWSGIKKEKPAWKLGFYHMILNLIAALVWAVNFGLRYSMRAGADAVPQVTTPIFVTTFVGTGLLLVSAYLGSLMVSDHGIGVARNSKKKWRAIAVRGGARVPEEK